jgi:hypothetical protein
MRTCSLSWGAQKSIASFHEKLNNDDISIRQNDYKKDLPENMTAECIRIRMSVYDSQSCKGPQVNVTIPLDFHEQHTEKVRKPRNVASITKFHQNWVFRQCRCS